MAAAPLNALGRHLALAGFMGSGKTTVGRALAERLKRPFIDLDAEFEARIGQTVQGFFAERGAPAFREVEEQIVADVLTGAESAVLALGGGAVLSEQTRAALAAQAFTVLLEVDVETAWERVGSSNRPLASDVAAFRALHGERQPVYEAVANARARDLDGATLAAAGVHVESGAIDRLAELLPGSGPAELVADAHVAGIYGVRAQLGLRTRDVSRHEVPAGEAAKSVAALEQLWKALRIGRDGTVVALGGGCTTDVVGFAAASYMRGVAWVPVPTSLVGQVDAAIGGKTAIDLPGAKNIVGAFHWPAAVVIDPALLETLPDTERRNGMAEVVKTGPLAGEPPWELSEAEMVRRCAAYKAGVCLADPHDHGVRNVLNLGHTFAHALEAAAGYSLSHGHAVALGLLAALRLSGQDEAVRMVERVLAPERVAVDREAAWAALHRDKKARGGSPRLVLLDAPGQPRWGVEVPEADVRAALDTLIL